MEFKDRGSFGRQPIEKQLDLLGHGLSHTEGQILSIKNCDGAWRILANMNNSHNVEVLVQVWDKDGETYEEVPLQNSRPYEYRLEKGVFN